MVKAQYSDKSHIVTILSSAFEENKSVNYIIPQDRKRKQRIRQLMEYSFDSCYLHGKVFLSDDRKACALIILADRKKTTFRTFLLDLKFVFSTIGLFNIKKVLARETAIKKLQPRELNYYLWFIGVDPVNQGKGAGSRLLQEVIADSQSLGRSICLETSTTKNLPWYQQFGFTIYNELNTGYKLYFLKRNIL